MLTCFGMFLLVNQLLAVHADATFTTRRGEAFHLFINGRVINHQPASQVQLNNFAAGNHTVEFRIVGYRSAFHTSIFLKPGHETTFELSINRHGRFALRPVRVTPIFQPVPPVIAYTPVPAPHPYGNIPDSYYHYNNSYHPNSNCHNLFSSFDINGLLQSMHNRSFESSKLALAQQAVSGGSILSDDVKRIMQSFTFESTRLNFAKFAYAYTCDTQNYYRVYDGFTYESSINNLERYLQGR
jgi:hypothetical protein